MEALTTIDRAMLYLEKEHQPTHVGGLQIFSLPAASSQGSPENIYETFKKTSKAQGLFTRKLSFKLGTPYWIEDKDFDIENHLFFHQLPESSDHSQLTRFAQYQHSLLLDRKVPLWECHFIVGFSKTQFAIYTKMHHALIDGVSAMNMLTEFFTPEATDIPTPFWNREYKKLRSRKKLGALGQAKALTNKLTKQLLSVTEIGNDLRKQFTGQAQFDRLFAAPKTNFNQNLSKSKVFSNKTIKRKRVKAIAEHFGCSTNDIILALCSTSLRNYLKQKNHLPSQPLIASVPSSLRTDKSIGGNEVGMLQVNLATEIESIISRTRAIIDSTRYEKSRLASLSKEAAMNIGFINNFPNLLQALSGLEMNHLPSNVIVSHVVTPKGNKYLGQAKLEAFYPLSGIFNGMGLNITLITDNDLIHFGIIACENAVPDLEALSEGLLTALDELESAIIPNEHEASIAKAS